MASNEYSLTAPASISLKTPYPTLSVVSPEWVGADPTGNTRADVIINSLLQAGYPVYIGPKDNFLLGATLLVPSGAVIFGPGKLTLGANASAITISGASNVVLSGFTINGQSGIYTSTSNNGVFVNWQTIAGSNVTIDGVIVENIAGAGIVALAAVGTPSTGIFINNNIVINTGAHGILAQGYISDVVITNNTVENTALLVADRPGITASRNGSNVVISNNICIGSSSALGTSTHGISLDTTANATCTGNVCTGWIAGYGIEIGGVTGASVTGNTIYSCKYGIVGSGNQGTFSNINVTVSGNQISNANAAGIYFFVTSADGTYLHKGITVGDNIIQNTSGATGIGINLQYIDGLIASNNLSEDSALSGIYIIDCINWFIDGNRSARNNLNGGLKSVTSVTESSSTGTVTVTGHGYSTNDLVSIFNASPTEYNQAGSTITVTGANAFTYALPQSGLTSPANGGIQCGKAKNSSHGGLLIQWPQIAINNQGQNRLGINTLEYNGFRDFYDIGYNGLTGITTDVLFLPDRPSDPRPENLTSGVSTNVEDRMACYMKNGKLVFAYNISGTVNYLTILLDGSTTTFTQSTSSP